MNEDFVGGIAARVREVREEQGVSQDDAAAALGVSQPTYSRIEDGTRNLKGDELVLLADFLGVRASTITGIAAVRKNAAFAARFDGTTTDMAEMRDRLYAYLELDRYLQGQGIRRAR